MHEPDLRLPGRRAALPLALAGLLAGGCDGARVLSADPVPACLRCHGAPPATGAHLAHATPPSMADVAYGSLAIAEDVDPDGATGRSFFGCGHCHPAAADEGARHGNGAVDVDLSPASGAASALKARNAPGAAWDPATGACAGVACHSSGQAAPAFVATPGWTSGAHPGCGGCHGNPPAYPNGGPGTNTANSHLGLDWNGWEWGHVFGLPGQFHSSKHGRPTAYAGAVPPADVRSSVVTCQTCHFETVDPDNTAPGGFQYLDTTVATELPGGDPARRGLAAWKDLQCATCHDGVTAPAGAGRVRPLRHVNGRRDVVFDPRTTRPEFLGGLLGEYAPTRPYFLTSFNRQMAGFVPAGAGLDGPIGGGTSEPTLSIELSGAGWDPATGTCSGVACHLQETSVRWGSTAFDPDPANPGVMPFEPCVACHPY